ncbi:MAG TPA: PPOX class F420-dependent oxidoreductase, partial [Chloroflexota bacterium]|nr:PPOX class F420-dependent oxidoreductase [Chloroflexota bacterium]
IQDPQNPYRYVQVRGRVVSESEDGAYDRICDLREKYHGDRNYPKNAGEQRVTYLVEPERYTTMG